MSSSYSLVICPLSFKEPYLQSWTLLKLRTRMIRLLMQLFANSYTLKTIMKFLSIISKENLTRRVIILHMLWLSLPLTNLQCNTFTRIRTSSCITLDKSAPLFWLTTKRMSPLQSNLLRRQIFQLLSALMFLTQFLRKFSIKIRSKR